MQSIEDILQERMTNAKTKSDTRAITLYKVIEELAKSQDCLYNFAQPSSDHGIKELYLLLDEKVPVEMTNPKEIAATIRGVEPSRFSALAARLLTHAGHVKNDIQDVKSIRAKAAILFPAPEEPKANKGSVRR
jgi:hypothetical protein